MVQSGCIVHGLTSWNYSSSDGILTFLTMRHTASYTPTQMLWIATGSRAMVDQRGNFEDIQMVYGKLNIPHLVSIIAISPL